MTRQRWKVKGRKDSGQRFALIPSEVIHSANWSHTSKPCRALVTDVAVQFSGHNNGDLTASISVMRPLGWTSSDTLRALLREAQHYGLLVMTRQGGLLIGASLYALGWRPVNACTDRKTGASKLDDPTMVGVTPGRWRIPQSKYQRPERSHKRKIATPPHGAVVALSRRRANKQSVAPRRLTAR
ncbi:MAG TPA: hypothetical protein VFY97_05805 [Rhodanobacteraceae bacterium]|jgi:hypothetical protein|nr:hypothetical protein [Rhodanobacteraceae bacterium]